MEEPTLPAAMGPAATPTRTAKSVPAACATRALAAASAAASGLETSSGALKAARKPSPVKVMTTPSWSLTTSAQSARKAFRVVITSLGSRSAAKGGEVADIHYQCGAVADMRGEGRLVGDQLAGDGLRHEAAERAGNAFAGGAFRFALGLGRDLGEEHPPRAIDGDRKDQGGDQDGGGFLDAVSPVPTKSRDRKIAS